VRRALATSAAPAMAAWLATQAQHPLLLGPDEESAQWVSAIAAPDGLEFGVARKQRLGDREVRIELPAMTFADRQIVLVDDIASTGHTLAETARQLSAHGPTSISILVTHALFVDDALARLRAAGVDVICSTDSVLHPSNQIHLDAILAAELRGD
jgi:ribose-phosphate pyrophosphokinase